MSPLLRDDDQPWRFFCVIFTRNQAPLLRIARLAQTALTLLQKTVHDYQAQLWGYVILPDSVQFVVEVVSEPVYHVCVEAFKAASEPLLCTMVQANYDELVDAITCYHPAHARPLYLFWQAGYQTQFLPSTYALSNKVADLVHKPVELGLVQQPEAWRFSSYQVGQESPE